jgi:hypothetical protein
LAFQTPHGQYEPLINRQSSKNPSDNLAFAKLNPQQKNKTPKAHNKKPLNGAVFLISKEK